MNNLDKQYQDLLQDILDNGMEKHTKNVLIWNITKRIEN